jgi:hypothetical protein
VLEKPAVPMTKRLAAGAVAMRSAATRHVIYITWR